MAELKVVKDTENPQPDEVIAQAIIEISAGMRKLNAGRLQRRAILLLLRDMTGLSMTDIEAVLLAMDRLEAKYIKPRPKVVGR